MAGLLFGGSRPLAVPHKSYCDERAKRFRANGLKPTCICRPGKRHGGRNG